MDGHPGSRKTLWPWVESGGVEVDGSLPKVTGVRAGQGEACPGALFQCCFPHKESEQPSPRSPVGPELQDPGVPHQAFACFQKEEQALFRKGPASLLDPSGRSLPGSRCSASLRGAETPPVAPGCPPGATVALRPQAACLSHHHSLDTPAPQSTLSTLLIFFSFIF